MNLVFTCLNLLKVLLNEGKDYKKIPKDYDD